MHEAIELTDAPRERDIICFIDAPDPDNFILVLALARLYPSSALYVSLSGRPVMFGAKEDTPSWDYDPDSSRLVQRINAARVMQFMRVCGHPMERVYDGGIAPRTLVPHSLHIPEYKAFEDLDPVDALQMCPALAPAAQLVRAMLAAPDRSFVAVVGGNITGLYNLLVQCPAVAAKLYDVHCMYGSWGKVEMMQISSAPRGAVQFNVACDPHAAHFVLGSLPCPVYLAPTEVTRVPAIGFADCEALAKAIAAKEAPAGFAREAAEAAMRMYRVWYESVVLPRKAKQPSELIYVHDLAPALSLRRESREAVYEYVPIEVEAVPADFGDPESWGLVRMRELPANTQGSLPRFAAKALRPGGPEAYLRTLRDLFLYRAPSSG